VKNEGGQGGLFTENRFEGRGYVYEVDIIMKRSRLKDGQPFANNDFRLVACLCVVLIMATLKDFK
jgi:hypothetical protein